MLSSRAEGAARSRGICGTGKQISPLPPVGRNDSKGPAVMTTTQLVEMTKSYGQNDNYEAGRQKDIGLALIV